MQRERRIILATIASVLAIGCHSDTVPTGTAGTVVVRAYIDSDGNGSYTATDVAISGATVSLAAGSGTPLTVATDANGNATFENVTPGSYKITISGSVPAGVVLSTAPSATLVVPFAGGSISGQFRYEQIPGTVSGVLFRDDNGNGTYDVGVDTPAPGMPVSLFAGTDASATPVATTSTDANGNYSFTTLRPGTYTVLITPIPTITLVGGNTRTVTVDAAGSAASPIKFTGNLLIPLSQVRSAPVGSTVAFTGTAEANAALFASNQLYVEDANGGVLVFGAPTAGIVAGDVVRVIGVTSVFNGELEVVAPTGGTLSVTKISSGNSPAPIAISVAQLLSNAFLGELITVSGVKVRSVVTTSATAYNVNFQGATPADTFQVRITNSNNIPIPSTFWEVNRTYTVSGVDGVFNGLHQLKPRAQTDVVTGSLPIFTIAAARQVLNDTVTVEGVVTAGRGTFRVDNAYIQDATGGTQIFNLPLSLALAVGDSVRVHGKMTVFSSENEIVNNVTPTDSIKVTKLGTVAPRTPRLVTGVQFAARTFEGQLLMLHSVTVTTIGNPSASGTYTVNGTAQDGTPVVIFMSAPVGAVPPPAATYLVGSQYDITGIAVPFSGAGELKPRGASDVVKLP